MSEKGLYFYKTFESQFKSGDLIGTVLHRFFSPLPGMFYFGSDLKGNLGFFFYVAQLPDFFVFVK
jgi:hypothetical protein